MKVRQGFVSNSSSSSFLIYGAYLPNGLNEQIESMAKEANLDIVYGHPDSTYVYLGRSWDSIGDNETGAQFKKSIENAVFSVLGADAKCATHQEAWYDG